MRHSVFKTQITHPSHVDTIRCGGEVTERPGKLFLRIFSTNWGPNGGFGAACRNFHKNESNNHDHWIHTHWYSISKGAEGCTSSKGADSLYKSADQSNNGTSAGCWAPTGHWKQYPWITSIQYTRQNRAKKFNHPRAYNADSKYFQPPN